MISRSTGVSLDRRSGWVSVVEDIARPSHWGTARSVRMQQGPMAHGIVNHIASVVVGVVAKDIHHLMAGGDQPRIFGLRPESVPPILVVVAGSLRRARSWCRKIAITRHNDVQARKVLDGLGSTVLEVEGTWPQNSSRLHHSSWRPGGMGLVLISSFLSTCCLVPKA